MKLLLLLSVVPLFAQDTRVVVEPAIPKSCVVLKSALPAPISEADETKPDTLRIQQAVDKCPEGQAVELTGPAFLSGPLQLRKGVTLLIDAKTTLFASRNARDYDIAPGSCGVVNQKGHGCRALINGDHVAG